MNYVVDTSIVNWLIDRKIAPNDMPGDGKFFATHVQVDEINRTRGLITPNLAMARSMVLSSPGLTP
jgi:hypothetical protein